MPDYSIVKIITALTASVVMVALNIFLSTRKNPLFAFIMPVLSFTVSIVFFVFSLVNTSLQNSSVSVPEITNIFLLMNIPTLVFVVTSLVSRYLHKKL